MIKFVTYCLIVIVAAALLWSLANHAIETDPAVGQASDQAWAELCASLGNAQWLVALAVFVVGCVIVGWGIGSLFGLGE